MNVWTPDSHLKLGPIPNSAIYLLSDCGELVKIFVTHFHHLRNRKNNNTILYKIIRPGVKLKDVVYKASNVEAVTEKAGSSGWLFAYAVVITSESPRVLKIGYFV